MSGGDQEVAAKLIVVEKREEQYASILLAERVEKKKKERERELQGIREDWISTLTKEYVEDKVSHAIMMGKSRVCLFGIPDEVEKKYEAREFEWLLKEMNRHLGEMCQFKGMCVTYANPSISYPGFANLYLVWGNPSCTCVCQ